MATYHTTLELDGEDVPVIVHYTAHKGYRGKTDGSYGPKLEPDEPAGIEIDWVEDSDGDAIELTKQELASLREDVAEREADE